MDLYFTPEKDTVFEALFGRAVIAWNAVEGEVRDFLVFLAGDRGKVEGLGPHIMVAEMGSRHLSETAQALADACFDGEERAAIHHVAVLYDNLIAYRNHYVHGIQHLHENVGCIGAFSAKSKFKVISGDVPIEEIGAFIDKVGDLFDYVIGVHAYLNNHEGGQTTLPDKPPQLPQLKKQTTLLPVRPPPPQSSRA
jgi:hypothetical protein